MGQSTLGKNHFGQPSVPPVAGGGFSADSISFGALSALPFDNVAAIGAGVGNATVQARLLVPQRCKIYKACVNFSAEVNAASFNVVVGNGAEAGTVAATDTIATAGQSLFAADKLISGGSADVPVNFVPDNWDGVYETATLLTLRAVTAGGGSITNLKVVLLYKPLDPSPKVTTVNPNTDF